jgi:hypothetical protein
VRVDVAVVTLSTCMQPEPFSLGCIVCPSLIISLIDYYTLSFISNTQSYQSFVQRIANISLLLAVMTPHALFLAAAVSVKCLVPRLCTTLVQSAGVRDILSWWYPLICTVLLLLDHDTNNNNKNDAAAADTAAATTTTSVDKENSAPTLSSTRTPEPRKRPLTNNGSSLFSPFSRKTTPKTSSSSSQSSSALLPSPAAARRWNRTSNSAQKTPTTPLYSRSRRRRQSLATPFRIITQQHQHLYSPSFRGSHSIRQQQQPPPAAPSQQHYPLQHAQHAPNYYSSLQEEQEADWLRFWIVRGTVQAFQVVLAWWTPVWLHSTLLHLEVLFYVWIYLLPYVQPESIGTTMSSTTVVGGKNGRVWMELPEGRPLQVLHDSYLQPAVEYLHDTISGAVPPDAWETYIVSNVRRLLSALVLVWMMQQETANAILHVVQESRSLVVPAVTLFMPYFVTAYGVVYVQYGLSLAKSAAATVQQQQQAQRQQHGDKSTSSCQRWLSYWVLHCALVAVLHRLQGILWWIPFSTHAIFILWCALSIPRNIDFVYQFVCDELRAFAILPPPPSQQRAAAHATTTSNGIADAAVVAAWQDTTTAKCLQWIWERLPKADSIIDDDDTAMVDDYHQPGSLNSNASSNDDDINEPNNINDDNLAGAVAESEQDNDDDDDEHMTDKNELDDDDYVPPLSSPSSIKQDVLATDAAKTRASVRRSTRVVRKPRS